MGKSQETFSKKEKEKKRAKQRQDKQEKMEERKQNAKKGKISSTPPDPRKMKEFRQEDMQISIPKQREGDQEPVVRTGVITFFNDAKGFGFIKDLVTQESIFIHVNQMLEPVVEKDRVVFEVEMGHKGPNATNVKKA